mmetsp:Transcript_63216/g.111975  ORF Transcript_63216/g.111975 Transcript_63216/m.111975 type:complete len:88 (-) Transcript_63216:601-864(-)
MRATALLVEPYVTQQETAAAKLGSVGLEVTPMAGYGMEKCGRRVGERGVERPAEDAVAYISLGGVPYQLSREEGECRMVGLTPREAE